MGLLLLAELVTLGNGPYTVLSSLVGNLIGMETPSWLMAILVMGGLVADEGALAEPAFAR